MTEIEPAHDVLPSPRENGQIVRDDSPLANVKLHLVDSIDRAWEFKRWLGERRDLLAVDTESGGLKPERDALRLVQFGDLETGWSIPWELWGGVALEALNTYEEEMGCHNLSHDAKFLIKHAGWKPPWHRMHDTMAQAHVLDPTRPKGLKALGARYVDPRATAGQSMLDDTMKTNGWTWATVPVDHPHYWVYGALDPVLTAHVDRIFRPKVLAAGAGPSYDLELAAIRVCTQMMLRGARVDLDYCRRKVTELREWAGQARHWLAEAFEIVNATSNAQVLSCLQGLGVVFTKLTGSRKGYALDKEVLDWVTTLGGEPALVAEHVLKIRKAEKICGSYLDNFLEMVDDEGMIHCIINTMAARTGRMSITDPAFQTLHRDDPTVRNGIIPSDGNVIISCDADQIEARLAAHFSEDQGLIDAFMAENDFFCEVASRLFGEPIVKGDRRRQITKNCVPLSSEILTKRGWLRHDEVVVGDETLGYDLNTRSVRWTRVNEIYHSPDAEVYRLSNSYKELFCTKDHRWIADTGRGSAQPRMIHAYEHAGTENRLILADVAPSGDDPLTTHEASILGWVLGDGSIHRGTYTGAPSQGRNGWKVKCEMTIYQSKLEMIAVIDDLLKEVPHRRYGGDGPGRKSWVIKSSWARPLLDRLKIVNKHDFDPWALALSLTSEARQTMLDALSMADNKNKDHRAVAIVQAADGPVSELCVALGYLLGRHVRIKRIEPDGHGWQRKPINVICHQKNTMTGQRASLEYVGREDTWCVVTDTGTWTMRQENGTPVLTGNTVYGRLYGAGATTIARTAKVTPEVAEAFIQRFDHQFPGLTQLMGSIMNEARHRYATEGRAYITTPLGRQLPVHDNKEYALLNYEIQGHAAEILKKGLVDLDAAGLGPYMLFPVHDEIVTDVPRKDAPELKHLIETTLTDAETYRVPLTWSADVFEDRWNIKG